MKENTMMTRKSLPAGCLATLSFLALIRLVTAAVAPVPLPAIPPTTQLDADTLNLATRAAIVCGTEYLLSDIATNETGYLVEPIIQRFVVGYKDVETKEVEVRYKKNMVHYKKVMVSIPIQEPIYESYETMAAVGEGASTEATRKIQKVTKQRIIGYKITGSNQVEREVRDPTGTIIKDEGEIRDTNGPIVKLEKVVVGQSNAVYDTKTTWPTHFLGMNGIALYAILKCDAVGQTGLVKTAIRTLKSDLTLRGIPDTTFDLAWLVAAFCNIKDPEFHPLRDVMLSKLIDGQIVEGPGRGLWGPICLRTDLFAAMIAHERNLSDRWDKAKAKLKEAPTQKSRIKSVEEAEIAFKSFIEQYKMVTMQGTRFEAVTTPLVIGLSKEDTITIPGLPFYLYTQNMGDLETTALVLFALREAALNNCLPKTTWRPLGATKAPVLASETPSAILARAANAIAARQKADGTWDACNIHQPINSFQPFGFVPITAEQTMALESEAYPVNTLQGINALLCAGQIVGMPTLMNKFGAQVKKGREAELKIAETYITASNSTLAVGRQGDPFDFFLQMAFIHRLPGTLQEERRELWAQLAHRVVLMQKDDGGWNTPAPVAYSSSYLEYRAQAARKAHEEQMAQLAEDKRTPFDIAKFRTQFQAQLAGRATSLEGRSLSTAYSMLFLFGGLREPVLGYLALGESETSPTVTAQALQLFNKSLKSDNPATLIKVSLQTPAAFINRIPVLYVEPDNSGFDAIGREVIKRYVSGTGFIVVGQRAGVTYDFATQWPQLLPGAKIKPIPATSPLLKDLKTVTPDKLTGLYGPEGQLTGLILKFGQGPELAPNEVSPVQMAQVLALATREYTADETRKDNLANRLLPSRQDPFVARIGALDRINARLFDKSKIPIRTAPAPTTPIEPASSSNQAAVATSAPEAGTPTASPTPVPKSADEAEDLPPAIATPAGPQTDEQW
jgi:hypothetical protein